MSANATSIAADKTRAELDALTHAIIGRAQKVSTALGMGFLEKVYENALCVELREAGLRVEQQRPVSVRYRETTVGEYVTDILVDQAVVIEVKAVDHISELHRSQCLHYLRATGHRICLLLNFGTARLQARRFVLKF